MSTRQTVLTVLAGLALAVLGVWAATAPAAPLGDDCASCVASAGAHGAAAAHADGRASPLDTASFPDRWECGNWPVPLGWLHIASDVVIWASYTAIPVMLFLFLRRKQREEHARVLWLFIAFILACGFGHLLEAATFWWPAYRVTGLVKLATAAVSAATAVALVPLIPKALQLRSPRDLEADVAERTKELARSEARHRATFDQAVVGIAHVGLDGSWLRVNRRLCDMLGYTEAELLVTDFQTITHPLDLDADLTQVEAVLEGRIASYSMEKRYVRKDDEIVWANLTVSLLRDEDGAPVHFVSIVDDITESRALRAELQRAHDVLEAEVARRTAELSRSNDELQEFAYVASHDLQEPLRTVSSFVQLLERRLGDDLDDEGREYIRFAVDGTARMKGLIQALLQYSRVGAGDRPRDEVVELDAVVDEVLADLSAAVEEAGAEVERDPLPAVRGDASELRQVVQNLLDNALKYRGDEPLRIALRARTEGDDAVLAVEDNGTGIDPEHAERVFEIFQRLTPATRVPGAGIGLAITKKIVGRHGGSIRIEAGPGGRGSRFVLTLPLAAEVPA